MIRRLLLSTVILGACLGSFPRADQSAPANAGDRLVRKDDLIHQGAFRVGPMFNFGGGALVFNPARGTLLMLGHDQRQEVAEISIPEIRAGALDTLATAEIVQPLTDLFEGKRLTIDGDTSQGVKTGGVLPFQDKLYLTAFSYYDANGGQTRSHFVRPLDFADKGKVEGPFKTMAPKAGFIAGYFIAVPQAWQAALGGPVLNGLCCVPIIGRTSSGPAAFAISPAHIGTVTPIPATPLLYYPIDIYTPANNHPLGKYGTANPYYNGTGGSAGGVLPEGTRSLLFFGTHGVGTYCYGTGTTDPAKVAASTATDVYCLDPTNPYKGTHGYPYAYKVWAYDANDLAAVKAGRKKPWDPKPYDHWELTLPLPASRHAVGGVAYDPATGRIFVSQMMADGTAPVVHVFTIGNSAR